MTDPQPQADATATESDLAETTLVEEVSIDGMCGVY
jgi:mycofactocin precursor